MSDDRIWQVRLPDGSVWIPADSRPGDPRASWIYARSTAQMFADKLDGEVVEVKPRQKEKVLDAEITSALAKPARPRRPQKLGRSARRDRALAIAEHVDLPATGRAALETARETADSAEYAAAIGRLAAALPAGLWVGSDDDHWYVQAAEPIWIAADPAGEDPAAWNRIDRAELARILVEDA